MAVKPSPRNETPAEKFGSAVVEIIVKCVP